MAKLWFRVLAYCWTNLMKVYQDNVEYRRNKTSFVLRKYSVLSFSSPLKKTDSVWITVIGFINRTMISKPSLRVCTKAKSLDVAVDNELPLNWFSRRWITLAVLKWRYKFASWLIKSLILTRCLRCVSGSSLLSLSYLTATWKTVRMCISANR